MPIRLVSPGSCRLWDLHDRLGEHISEQTCSSLIQSIQLHGQKHPVLARKIADPDGYEFELIYGARRLFAARQLGIKLLLDVREIDDVAGLVEMDIENRVRADITPYERGLSYRRWLNSGYFATQTDIAKALGVSESRISKLLRYAELPAAIVGAFDEVGDIREDWAGALAKACRDPDTRQLILRRARSCTRSGQPVKSSPHSIYHSLIRGERPRALQREGRSEVVKDASGTPMFRIVFRANSVHLVIPKERITGFVLETISVQVRTALECREMEVPHQLSAAQ